jgi:sulfur carrier protein
VIVVVNGQPREVEEGTSLLDLLPEAPGRSRGTAIARNSEVVPKTSWAAVQLQAGDRVEVLNAIGGG